VAKLEDHLVDDRVQHHSDAQPADHERDAKEQVDERGGRIKTFRQPTSP